MALSFGWSASMTSRCASSTSTGLTARVRISRASSRADLRTRVLSVMATLLPGPMHEAPLYEQEQQIESIADRARGENHRVHPRHVEQLLRLENAVADALLEADEHIGDNDDDHNERNSVAHHYASLRQGL